MIEQPASALSSSACPGCRCASRAASSKRTKRHRDATLHTKRLRLPAEAPNGSRLPCRADAKKLFALAGPSPGSTARALARLLLGPHSQSTARSADARTAGTTPPTAMDLPRLVTHIELVVRSLDGPPVRLIAVHLGLSSLAAFTSMNYHRRFLRAERGSTRLPTRESRSQFGSFDLARRLDRPLWYAARLCGRHTAHSVWAPTLTGKPFRALERVELFPVRFSGCQS